MRIELLPCPFCSGEAITGSETGLWCVTCHQCHAEGPSFQAEEEAVRRWNCRAFVARPQGGAGGRELRDAHPEEYNTWSSMLQRCHNPTHDRYEDYGGRGIIVCKRWRESFAAFVEDMGARPSGRTLDRIDNNGIYEPVNCRWATPKQQNENARRSKQLWVEFRGEERPLREWCELLRVEERGLTPACIALRLSRYGWTPEEAFTVPPNHSNGRKRQKKGRWSRLRKASVTNP
jgi:hypothetical protein